MEQLCQFCLEWEKAVMPIQKMRIFATKYIPYGKL